MSNGTPQASITTIQIIAAALMMGVVMFGAVAGFIGKDVDGDPLLAYIAAGFSCMIVPMRFVVPGLFAKTNRASLLNDDPATERSDFLALYQTKTIIEYALQEGACFLCLTAFLITGEWMLFAIVAAFLLSMAAAFPSEGRFGDWYRRQRETAQLERND